jgi:hypothetical protein
VEESYPVAYNLGCGDKHWEGWINVDVSGKCDLISDIRNLDAVPPDSADAVAAIHVLEHFYRWEVPDMLKEWHRILNLELPCMDKVFGYVVQCLRKGEAMMPFMSLHALYGDPKHEDPLMMHKYGWFAAELIRVVTEAGFSKIRLVVPRYHFAFRDQRIEAIK